MANSDRVKYNAYMKEYMKRRYYEKRQEAIGILGGVCIECGSVEDLQIDHIDPSKKSGDIAKLWTYSLERFFQELAKCQILCEDCHKKKTSVDIRVMRTGHKELQHGTQWKYKKEGCRCEPCCKASSEANKRHKQTAKLKKNKPR